MEGEEKTVSVDVDEAFIIKSDAGDLCRLCANTDNQLIPIFKGEGIEHNIPTKIEKHLPIIKVTEIDKLPLQICYQCASTLIAWHNLYEGCLIADKRLREILSISEKGFQEDDTFDNYVDDYRDDYDDQSRSNFDTLPLNSAPSTSNLAGDDLLKSNSIEISQLSESKEPNETELDNTDERYAARGTRKRGPLITKNPTNEERAKIVKSKKIRLLPQTKTSKIEKHKCSICGVAFTDVNDLVWHKDAAHANQDIIVEEVTKKTTKVGEMKTRRSARTREKNETKTLNKENVGNASSSNLKTSSSKPSLNYVQLKVGTHCFICGGKLAKDNDYKSHRCPPHDQIAKVTRERKPHDDTFYCHHCEYACKRKYTLKCHIQRSHMDLKGRSCDTSNSMKTCAMCQRSFSRKSNLRRHVFDQHLARAGGPKCVMKKGYCCDICGEGFNDQREMLAHRDVLHENASPMSWESFCASMKKVMFCYACGRYFSYEKEFSQHLCERPEYAEKKVICILESKPLYKCDSCSRCFHWKWMYRSHRESSHPHAEPLVWDTLAMDNIEHCCLICCENFNNSVDLQLHEPYCMKKAQSKLKSFVCDLCGSSFVRKSDCRRHKRNKHADGKDRISDEEGFSSSRKKCVIRCPYCDISMTTRNSILTHIKSVHNIETDTPFLCIPCNKVFKRKATMDAHNEVYHPEKEDTEETNKILKESEILLNGETAYHCNVCNRNVLNSIRFLAHYRLHYVERKFTCDLCGKQTRTQHQLNMHIKIIHLNIRNHKCDICDKTFHSRQSCEEHRRIHTGERPFSCEICGKTFIAMNALLTHKKFHNDFYAHPCSMCPKKFKVRRSLINHIRTHTGERPFKCELCPKTFNNSSRFSYHKKVTHSDNRPFTCTECGSCFKANKFLIRHMKLHKIRTHIQFRRRNNPAYFATQSGNSAGNNDTQKKGDQTHNMCIEEVIGLDYKSENEGVMPTIYTIRSVYENEVEVELKENSNIIADSNLVDAKSHFLTEGFSNSGQLTFPSPSASTTPAGPSDNKHNIICL